MLNSKTDEKINEDEKEDEVREPGNENISISKDSFFKNQEIELLELSIEKIQKGDSLQHSGQCQQRELPQDMNIENVVNEDLPKSLQQEEEAGFQEVNRLHDQGKYEAILELSNLLMEPSPEKGKTEENLQLQEKERNKRPSRNVQMRSTNCMNEQEEDIDLQINSDTGRE